MLSVVNGATGFWAGLEGCSSCWRMLLDEARDQCGSDTHTHAWTWFFDDWEVHTSPGYISGSTILVTEIPMRLLMGCAMRNLVLIGLYGFKIDPRSFEANYRLQTSSCTHSHDPLWLMAARMVYGLRGDLHLYINWWEWEWRKWILMWLLLYKYFNAGFCTII